MQTVAFISNFTLLRIEFACHVNIHREIKSTTITNTINQRMLKRNDKTYGDSTLVLHTGNHSKHTGNHSKHTMKFLA